LTSEHAHSTHELLERIAEPPLAVGGIEVVRRHRDGDAGELGGVEQFADVRHRVVLGDAVAEYRPGRPIRTEEVHLWVGDHQGRMLEVEFEAGGR
jgi:hypothetical protein